MADDQTDDVLQGDQQAGCQCDHGSQLAASLLQQLGREAIANAHEEDVLGQILDVGGVKAEVDHASTADDGEDDRNDQTGNNRGGDAVLLQEFAVRDQPVTKEDNASRNAKRHHVVELEPGDGDVLTNGGQFAKIAEQIHNKILLYFSNLAKGDIQRGVQLAFEHEHLPSIGKKPHGRGDRAILSDKIQK